MDATGSEFGGMHRHAATATSGDETNCLTADVVDLVGVGFGPSNLALAIAATEHLAAQAGLGVSARFFEAQATFGWHRGMLLDDATMQVSFLKDLATMRDPTSGFSFLSYLAARGRLVDFINHKTIFPSRIEFHDYLEWAAARVHPLVTYGARVVGVRPVVDPRTPGEVHELDVEVRLANGGTVVQRTRNVVLGQGLQPRLPDDVTPSDRVWHNHDLLHRLGQLPTRPHRRFTVVGAGQSAAEVAEHLHTRFPDSEVCAVFTRYGYSPSDDSAFANKIFDPTAVDDYFYASDEVKNTLLDYHRNTNYSVVDIDLIDELYRRTYQEQVRGERRLRVVNASRVTALTPLSEGVRTTVEFLPTGEISELDSDVVIFATGYTPRDPLAMLGDLAPAVSRDAAGRPVLSRDYRLLTPPTVTCGIYLQGSTEHSHGISSSLLSNVAVRSGEILDSVVRRRDVAATDIDAETEDPAALDQTFALSP